MPISEDCQQERSASIGESGHERRRHPRYRSSTPITAHGSSGSPVPAITIEISESGLSALTGAPFRVGDRVDLDPIGGGKAAAIVRRNIGKVCAFEFLQLTTEQVQYIRDRCKRLPLFRSRSLDI